MSSRHSVAQKEAWRLERLKSNLAATIVRFLIKVNGAQAVPTRDIFSGVQRLHPEATVEDVAWILLDLKQAGRVVSRTCTAWTWLVAGPESAKGPGPPPLSDTLPP